MKRLTLLNLALVVLIAAGGWRLYSRAQSRASAEAAFLAQRVQAAPAPIVALPEAPAPVRPAAYIEIAAQLPFHPERNPEVVIEAPAPKPMPELPRFYGLMNFGAGPRVVLAAAAGQPQKSYQVGERIGEFTLQAISDDGLTFGWEGQAVTAPYAKIRDTAPPPETAAAKPAETRAAAKPAATTVSTQAARGPGDEIGGSLRACQPGDNTPAGAVVGGYRKVVSKTPFGDSCRWERVN